MRVIKAGAFALFTALVIIVLVLAGGAGAAYAPESGARRTGDTPAYREVLEGVELAPDNTVILSNETDGSFCRDFSVLLSRLRLEWITLESPGVSESVRDKNLIIVGRLDSEFTGDMIAELMPREQVDYLRQGGHYSVFEKESPWNDNRIIYISAGSDLLLTKEAAERAITSILDEAQDRAEWYLPASSVSRDEAAAYLFQIQHVPEDDELPSESLAIDVDARSARSVSAEEAAADVEHLFYLLSHGWCGYGYYATKGDFDAARESILGTLEKEPRWSPDDLTQLVHEHLSFVHDCHLRLGDKNFCRHLDFWYDTSLELGKRGGEYHFISDNVQYQVVSINGQPPADFTFPSLNAQGDAIYRVAVLSYSAPEPLVLIAQDGDEQSQLEIELSSSAFHSGDKFGEERIGGIPVLRVRSFADYYADDLEQFLQAAVKYKGEPYVILDIRGNPGGNTRWPKGWIARFTGQSPSLKHILTEFVSRTTMMGRANLFAEMLDSYPKDDAHWIQAEIDGYQARAVAFDRPTVAPHWTWLQFPGTQLIPNDTTLIIIADRGVFSAGEGLLSYVFRQVENVVVVGENSGGAVTFGQVSTHQLPHSHLRVTLPIKLNAMVDLEWREERGYYPDLWVPPVDALNYAVAAARKGTITTQKDLPEGYFEAAFVPERRMKSNWTSGNEKTLAKMVLVITSVVVLSSIVRKKLKR